MAAITLSILLLMEEPAVCEDVVVLLASDRCLWQRLTNHHYIWSWQLWLGLPQESVWLGSVVQSNKPGSAEESGYLLEETATSAAYPTGIGQLVITREVLRQCGRPNGLYGGSDAADQYQ